MAGNSALIPVQTLVYTRLSGDATLTALSKTYDEVPTDAVFPWVLLTDFEETLDNTFGEEGRSVQVGIDVWSQVPGFKELQSIAEEVIRLLNSDTGIGNPTGWQTDWSMYVKGRLDREADGLTRHARLDFVIAVHR